MTRSESDRRPRSADSRGRSGGAPGRHPASAGRRPRSPDRRDPGRTSRLPSGPAARIAAAFATAAVVLVGILAVGLLSGSFTASQHTASGEGTTVQANGGHWTNITPDRLATMLEHKDFTLLNVKTPYIGEITGTDLYIPYDQVGARSAELPADKRARLVVYCRTGHESAIAAQSLIDLGYTNIDNLDGGMTAWTASGRQLVTIDRSGG